jgi:hypothetical protein
MSAVSSQWSLQSLEGRTLLSSPGHAPHVPKTAPAPQALIYDAGATIKGKTIGEWSAEWWKWALLFGSDQNPFNDPTGANASLRQRGPVFFAAGTSGGDAERTFEVQGNKPVLIPLLVAELSELELGTGADVRGEVNALADMIDQLHFSVDGVEVSQADLLANHRHESPDFEFVAAEGNPIGVPAGESGLAVADGYWVMLRPLGKGTHTVSFGGGISSFDYAVSVDATIRPKAGSANGHGHSNQDDVFARGNAILFDC